MIIVFHTLLQVLNGGSVKSRIAKKSLIFETNFDLPESTQSDIRIIVRMLYRTYKSVFSAKRISRQVIAESPVAGLGESANVWAIHEKFNDKNGLPTLGMRLNYGGLMQELTKQEFWALVFMPMLILPLVLFQSIFSDRRASYAICMLYACQIYLIDNRMRQSYSKVLIDYTAYSNQSNWLALILMKRGVEVFKVPSIGPLSAHLKNVIASKLWLSTPYQQDEAKAFAGSHVVGKYLKGKPKNAFYLDKYESVRLQAIPKVLGYYSHASWVRAEQDHGASEFGLPALEATLLRHLVEYCISHPEIKLHVFTHPRERKPEMLSKTKAYYKELISDDIKFQIYFGEEKSSLSFEAAEVGVGTMSSILFERLLCGFKTLFYTESMKSFPVSNSNISSTCAPNKDKLFEMLDEQFANAAHPILDQYRYDSEFYTRKQ